MKINFNTEVPTLDELHSVLEEGFKGKYEIVKFTFGVNRVIVKKSGFIAAVIVPKSKKNFLQLNGHFGNPWLSGIVGLIFYPFLLSGWKKMEREVNEFLQTKYSDKIVQ
ncbi:MAG: hypothetical protein L3J35_13440 [Bacteroidales bacterium]|nr:hypothetical protein [Bacteroidales bacterium]